MFLVFSSFLRLTRSRLAIFWGRSVACGSIIGFVSLYVCVSKCTLWHTEVKRVEPAVIKVFIRAGVLRGKEARSVWRVTEGSVSQPDSSRKVVHLLCSS